MDALAPLMADDMVFLKPGREPFGKREFPEGSSQSAAKVKISVQADVKEVRVAGDHVVRAVNQRVPSRGLTRRSPSVRPKICPVRIRMNLSDTSWSWSRTAQLSPAERSRSYQRRGF